jgi:hypothetical protein
LARLSPEQWDEQGGHNDVHLLGVKDNTILTSWSRDIQHVTDLMQQRIDDVGLYPGVPGAHIVVEQLTSTFPQSFGKLWDLGKRLKHSTIAHIDW